MGEEQFAVHVFSVVSVYRLNSLEYTNNVSPSLRWINSSASTFHTYSFRPGYQKAGQMKTIKVTSVGYLLSGLS